MFRCQFDIIVMFLCISVFFFIVLSHFWYFFCVFLFSIQTWIWTRIEIQCFLWVPRVEIRLTVYRAFSIWRFSCFFPNSSRINLGWFLNHQGMKQINMNSLEASRTTNNIKILKTAESESESEALYQLVHWHGILNIIYYTTRAAPLYYSMVSRSRWCFPGDPLQFSWPLVGHNYSKSV